MACHRGDGKPVPEPGYGRGLFKVEPDIRRIDDFIWRGDWGTWVFVLLGNLLWSCGNASKYVVKYDCNEL